MNACARVGQPAHAAAARRASRLWRYLCGAALAQEQLAAAGERDAADELACAHAMHMPRTHEGVHTWIHAGGACSAERDAAEERAPKEPNESKCQPSVADGAPGT